MRKTDALRVDVLCQMMTLAEWPVHNLETFACSQSFGEQQPVSDEADYSNNMSLHGGLDAISVVYKMVHFDFFLLCCTAGLGLSTAL